MSEPARNLAGSVFAWLRGFWESCQAGTSAAACGASGIPCGVCSGLQGTCFAGACHCDVCGSGCAFSSVQAAIDAASSGATITLCAGTYIGNVTIGKNLSLMGAGDAGAGETRLTGTGLGRVVRIPTGVTVILQDLRISGGGGPDGGGIANFNTLTLTDSTVELNVATNNGGGIYNDGTATLNHSDVVLNSAAFGGGIYKNAGTVTLTNSVVSGNNPDNCLPPASIPGCIG